MDFDTVVVGAGPAGMTLAACLPGRVCVLEQNEEIGGCHYVDRHAGGLFSEHGPRVYSGAYVNVRAMLRRIGLRWDDVFVRHPFSPQLIDGKRWYQWLSARESLALSAAFVRWWALGDAWARAVSVDEWAAGHGFSRASREYLDLVCRFSDGAGSARYSLHEFLSGFDQHALHAFYEPRRALDASLWPAWRAHVERRGGVVVAGAPVERIEHRGGAATAVVAGGVSYRAARFVFAVPPVALAELLRASGLDEPGFADFARRTRYAEYWSLACHYRAPVPAVQLRSTPWGLMYVAMPMRGEAMHVVSVAATRRDVASPATGKTLKQTTRAREAAAEIVRQLRAATGLPEPERVTWPTPKHGDHEAFVAAAGTPFRGPQLACLRNALSVGCHNGRSSYNFTSFESAVQNALHAAGEPVDGALAVTDLATLAVLAAAAWLVLRRT